MARLGDRFRPALGSVTALALLLFLAATPTNVEAQADTVRIPYRIACPSCRIDFVKVLTLGKPTDPVLISTRSNVVRNSRSQYFASSYTAEQVVVFDSTGKYLTAFGRPGRGPGEFEPGGFTALQIDSRDSLFVLSQGSVIVFGPDLRFARSYRITLPVVAHITTHGAVIGSGPLRLPDAIGYDFHEFDTSGNHVRSFGNDRRQVMPGIQAPEKSIRFGLSRNEDALWAGLLDQYVLGRFQLGENRARVYSIEGAKYVPPGPIPWPVMHNGDAARWEREVLAMPPRAFMQVLGEDANGRIWVNWLVPSQGASRRRILEIVDPANRQILLSQQLARAMAFVPGSALVSTSEVDQNGVIAIVISIPTLRRE